MNDYMNNLPDPEEFWPDAEKMLNGHFQAKRRRRAAILLSALLISLSAVLYFSQDNDQPVSAENSSAAQEQLSVQQPETNPVNEQPAVNPVVTPVERKAQESVTGEPANETHSVNEATHSVQAAVQKPAETRAATAPSKPITATADQYHSVKHIVTPDVPVQPEIKSGQQQPSAQGLHLNLAMSSETKKEEEQLPAVLEPLQFLTVSSIRFPMGEAASISEKQAVKPAPKHPSKLSILAYGGMSYVDKVINSPGNTIYMQRREKEESATFLPSGGIQIARSSSKLEIRAGIGFSVLGEKVNYSPYKNGTYYNSYLDWDPYTYTVTDTDSAWIFGMLFLQTSSQTINDSIQVTKTDTLNGSHYDASILAANGTNRWYLVQLPIELSYPVVRGRFGIAVNGGIAPGIIIGSEGKYLLKDESGVKEISREAKGTFMLSVGGGLEFSYLLGERFSLLLQPSVRYFITPIEEENGASKNYRTYGINAGIRYSLR